MANPDSSKNPETSAPAADLNPAVRCPQWPGLLAIAAAFVALAALSWRKWPDPLIDFGQQLYVPWRLVHGAVLYHDVSYVYGCLSVCYHAMLFKIFGASLNIVLASNFLILIFLLLLIYKLFLKCSDGLTATVAGLALTVIAFSQLLDVGNYNYICPYSNEEFHGLVLSVVMMAGLARWWQSRRILPIVLSGACLGLIFMTKPEIFVAALAPWAVAGIFQRRRISPAALAKSFLLAAGSALIPPAGFFFRFHSQTNPADALRAVCGAWMPLFHSTGLKIPIYRRITGLDMPWFHVREALVEFGALTLVVAICAWRLTRPTLTSLERAILLGLVGGASILYGWQNSGHALPLLLAVAIVLWWREWRLTVRMEDGGLKIENASSPSSMLQSPSSLLIFPVLWLVFSFLMLAKLGFNPRFAHYGVFLAMPAFLSAIYLLLHLLPRFLERRGLESKTFRAAMLVLLLAGLARLLIQSALFYKDKDFSLGSGGDRMVAYNPKIDPTAPAMASAVAWIETNTAPTNTLAVIPEGVMLNYLTRRVNPTPYAVFAFEVSAFGEPTMLAAYEKNPPDYIVLAHRDTSEYGVPFFGAGKGFGQDLMQWVSRNYQPVYQIGDEPLQTGGFGMKILKRISPETPAGQLLK